MRRTRTCANCRGTGHMATYKGKWTCPHPKKYENAPRITWSAYANRKEGVPFILSSSSPESASEPGSLPETTERTPPPIDLASPESAPSAPSPLPPQEQETPREVPLSNQPSPTPPPSPSPSNPPPSQQARNLDAEAFGKLAAQYWVAGLNMANSYVQAHGGFCLAKELVKMNEIAMQHLATKYALETGSKPEDMAAGTVVVSGALMGGQSAWFAYKDYQAKEKKPRAIDAKPVPGPAVQPSTGRAVPLVSVPNGVPTEGGKHPTAKPGGPAVPDIYG